MLGDVAPNGNTLSGLKGTFGSLHLTAPAVTGLLLSEFGSGRSTACVTGAMHCSSAVEHGQSVVYYGVTHRDQYILFHGGGVLE